MKNGRSTYNLNFSCNPGLVNNVIQSYLQVNKYELQQKDNETYYRAGEPMIKGYKYFKYFINGGTVTIYAWFKGAFGEVPIEQGDLNINAMEYRNSLNTLFQEINNLNNQSNNNNNNNQMNNMNQNNMNQNNMNQNNMNQNNVNQFTQSFQNETIRKQEKMCEIGFWFSIFGLLISFIGISYGAILYAVNIYFGVQGLKTSKSGKAIATIILSILSFFMIVFWVAKSNGL